jgi:hypothetical protein
VVFAVVLDCEAQEDRCAARIAAVHETDVLRAMLEKVIDVRNGLRRHVRIDVAVRALETDLLVVFEQEPLIPVQNYPHLRS